MTIHLRDTMSGNLVVKSKHNFLCGLFTYFLVA